MSDIENEIKLIRRSDSAAFTRLYEKYAPLINSLSDKYVKEYESLNLSADDIKQEAAIALYSAALTYNFGSSVTFGLYAKICIKNRIVSYIRDSIAKVVSDRITEDFDSFAVSEVQANPNEQPLNAIIAQENFDTLQNKIRTCLTEYEYSVFILYSEGVSIKIIAERLGKDIKSIYNTITRVKKKLKSLVNEKAD